MQIIQIANASYFQQIDSPCDCISPQHIGQGLLMNDSNCNINPMDNNLRIKLNVDQAKKLNHRLPKGYKVVSVEDYKKKLAQSKRKSKVIYVPRVEPHIQPRRNKQKVSYVQDDAIESKQVNAKNTFYDQEIPEIAYNRKQSGIENGLERKYKSQKIVEQVRMPELRVPLTCQQFLQNIKEHPNFAAFQEFARQLSPPLLKHIQDRCWSTNYQYSVLEFELDLKKLFIKIYQSTQKEHPIYKDTVELQCYVNNLMGLYKVKQKQADRQKEQEYGPIEEDFFSNSLTMNRAPTTLNRKKTTLSKPEIKNITITDKRVLGQNIKKLPSGYLPEICRIVFDTLETREEYVIDIDTLPLKKVKQLQLYVETCIQNLDDFVDCQLKNQQDSSESVFVIEDDFD